MIRISYLPMKDLQLLDRNPKKHDIERLIASFQQYGFRDAPVLDDTLKSILAGNGRVTALNVMKQRGIPAPNGILVKDGEWYVPVQTGIGSKSMAEAISFAIDHNNITLLGGTFDIAEIAKIWTPGYVELLLEMAKAGVFPVSVTGDDLDLLLHYSDYVPDHEARPLENLEGYEAIGIMVSSVEYFDDVITAVHSLVGMHPLWQAKVM